jgi:hypothetical protein
VQRVKKKVETFWVRKGKKKKRSSLELNPHRQKKEKDEV